MSARWFLAETPAQGVAGNPYSYEIEEGFIMKKQEIRKAYTEKVSELLADGYIIFPDTMRGHQGEIAHIDLSNGSEILRVLLYRDCRYDRDEKGYHGDTMVLVVGKAAEDTRVYDNWDGTIWNQRLEPRFQIEWAEISDGSRRGSDWYTTLEEGARIQEKQYARYKAQDSRIREELGQAFKSIALKWVRRQPRMKSCRLEDIERMERVIGCNERRYFEIRAKGKTYTMGR